MALSTDQSMTLISAGVLAGRAGDVLSEFEAQLVREVCERFVLHRSETVVTAAEWPVIEGAVEAMRSVVAAQIRAAEMEAA